MKKWISFSLFFIISFQVQGKSKNYLQLERQVKNKENIINKLSGEISDIEENVGKVNISYLDKVKLIENIELQINQLQIDLDKNAKKVSHEYRLTKKALNIYLLETLDNDYENEELREKLYKSVLYNKILELEKIQTLSAKLLQSVQELDQKLIASKQSEEQIYNKIVQLENVKKEKGQKYIGLLEEKNKMQDQLEKMMIKLKTSNRPRVASSKISPTNNHVIDFGLPLTEYISVSKSKKGLNFQYQDVTPVYAPSSGVIVYAGELSTYGKVVIVDHGKNIRSVFLGDLSIKLKKGHQVNKGQILAYTSPVVGERKSLYYEIRKENKVQDTYSWFKNLKITGNKLTKI